MSLPRNLRLLFLILRTAPKLYLSGKLLVVITLKILRCAHRFMQLKAHIYAVAPESSLFIGKPNIGHISNYYLGEPIDDDEVASVQAAAEKLGIDVLNTRSVIHQATHQWLA